MSFHQRDEIRWNKRGYYERFDGKKYWRKLCVIEGCMKRAKVLNWCKRHYTEQKQKNLTTNISNSPSIIRSLPSVSTSTENLLLGQSHYHLQGVSQIPMPPPAYLYTSTSNSVTTSPQFHLPNEIRLNKRGFREQYDGNGRWRPLCTWQDCMKRAKKLSFCKRHYTEQVTKGNSIKDEKQDIQ